jgi:hypothetical protein
MADLRFFNAFLIPGKTIILGKHLKPFALKHRIWLEAINSPFSEPNKEITQSDLIVALKLCAGEMIDKKTFKDYWIMFKLIRDKELFQRACKAFINYIETEHTWPKFYEKNDKSGQSNSFPWQLKIVANLVSNGISYADALSMPEAKAIWLSCAFNHNAGVTLDLLTTDDEALIDHLAKLRDEELKQKQPK